MPTNKQVIPKTVGEFIELLKKFPADYFINVYKKVTYDGGSKHDESAYMMTLYGLDECESVELTIV